MIEILQHKDFMDSKMKLPYAIGFDEIGTPCIEDIEEYPHLLIGGATFSGKSTAIMCLLLSVAYKQRTGDVNVVIMDFLDKMGSEYTIFNDQPVMSCPVITDPLVGTKAIWALYKEMNNRPKDQDEKRVPYIVCIIDEFPKLFTSVVNKEERSRLKTVLEEILSVGRHANIHLVLAVQNPKKNSMVIDKANFQAKMALKCGNLSNSVAILGRAGADKLVGKGQMILDSLDKANKRLQGSFITKAGMKELLSEIKESFEQRNEHQFIIKDMELVSNSIESDPETSSSPQISPQIFDDEKLPNAIMWSLSQKQIANSRLQEYLKIGNTRANRLLKRMEELHLIERLHGNLGWAVLPECIENMSVEAIRFLKSYGHTEATINRALLKKLNNIANI